MKRLLLIASIVALSVPFASNGQVIYPNRGGLGTSTIPSYGQIPVGNAQGTYTLTATSSLGIQAGTNLSTDPLTATYFTATGTATSTLPKLSITSALSILGEYITDLTTWVRGKIDAYLTGGEGVTYSSGAISFDCSEVEGTGINCAGEDITLDATGDWTGTFDGLNGSDFLSLSTWYATTTDGLDEGSTNRYYTDARARAAISETTSGLTYSNSTGVLSMASGYEIPLTASTSEWATAYGWGNHATAGYITTDGQFSTTSADYWDTTKLRWATTSSDYWLTTNSTTNLAEGSNLYFTPARALAALTGQNVQGRYFTATSTSDRSTFAGSLSVGSSTNTLGLFHVIGGNTSGSTAQGNASLAEFGGYINSPYVSFGEYQNFLLQTEVFDNASWIKNGVGAVTANTAIAPDGTLIAENISAGAGATDGVWQWRAVTNSAPLAFSVWLRSQGNTGTANLRVDYGNGSATTTGTAKTVTLSPAWERYGVLEPVGGPYTHVVVHIQNGTDAISAWGAQLEATSTGAYSGAQTTAAVTTLTRTLRLRGAVNMNSSLAITGALSGVTTAGLSGILTQTMTGLATTTTQTSQGLRLLNSTAATNGARGQQAPALYWEGRTWDLGAGASRTTGWELRQDIISANPGSSNMNFNYAYAGAGTTTVLTIGGTGNVGIGTSSPYAKLSVAGQAVAAYFTATTTTASTFPYASTTALSVAANAYFPGSGIWSASGNVGIGTTSPGKILDVVTSSGTDGIRLTRGGETKFYAQADGTVQWGPATSIGTLTWDTGEAAIKSGSGTGLSFQTNGATTDRLFITTAGNVGIGTTTPTIGAELDVYGNVFSTGSGGGSFSAANPLNQSAHVTLGWLNDVARVRVGGTGNGSAGGFDIQTTGDASLLRVLHNGNVGIGTTSPYAKLSVNGQTVAAYYTATTTTASTFPYASTTGVSATTLWGALTGNVTGTASGNDVLGQATSTLSSHTTTYNHANYDTAYGWGNHASAGYQTAANVYSIVGGTTTLANLTITAAQVSDLTASVNSYIHGSTTIPKTYTANNTFTGLQTFGNASTTAISANTICILTDCRSAWPVGGSGISSLNGLTDATQTFATSSDTNIGLTITSAGTAHTFTSSWTGSLAVSRGGTGHTAIASGALLYGSGTAAVATSSNLILRPTTAETIADGYARIYHTATNDMYFQTTTDDPAFVFSAGYDIFRIDAENSVLSSGFPFDVNNSLANTFGGPLVAESGTSTFTGIQIGSNGLQVSTLNAASCDLKATTDGTFYCGTDATGVGGSGVVASSTATYVVYKLGSTYYAYNATTTAVTSNADFDVLLQSLVDVLDGGRAGGIIHIKSGDYYANATTSIAGNDSGSYNNGGRVTIQGDGTDSTRIIMYGNADFLDFEDAAIFSVKDLSVYVTGGSNGFVADSNDNDTRAAWLFNFENVHVAATTTHTGRAFDLGNVFRGRFENIEMFGVHHCMRFRAEGTFNPGDFVLSRAFCELDNTANGISYEFTEDSTGFMNQVHFEMVEGIAQSTGATFIKAEDLSFATLYNLNAEQYDILVDQQVGSGVTYHFNYATHRTGAASLKGCRFATGASGNTCEFRMLNTSANFQVIDDANTWGDNPNTFIGYIGADSGTASASSSGTTVYRDVKGYGTLDTNLAPGGLFGIFVRIR